MNKTCTNVWFKKNLLLTISHPLTGTLSWPKIIDTDILWLSWKCSWYACELQSGMNLQLCRTVFNTKPMCNFTPASLCAFMMASRLSLSSPRRVLTVENKSLKRLYATHQKWIQQGDAHLLGNTNLLTAYIYLIPVSISTIIRSGYVTSALCVGW